MGQSRTFEVLFPGARHTLLSAMFGEPERWWTVEELAGRAGVRPGAISSHLSKLRETGVLRQQRAQQKTTFQPDPDCEIFAELHAMVMKLTSGSAGETILVVEDTAATAQIARILLESWGYRALEAHSAGEALNLFEDNLADVRLLLTDVNMPEMNGPQLAGELRRRKPNMSVVFMSGYPDDDLHGGEEIFLAKPFNPAALSHVVRKALDGAAAFHAGQRKRINGR